MSKIYPPTLKCEELIRSAVPGNFLLLHGIKSPHEFRSNASDAKMSVYMIEPDAICRVRSRTFPCRPIQYAKHKAVGHLLVINFALQAELVSVLAKMQSSFHYVRE
jgi:hypothetical protein